MTNKKFSFLLLFLTLNLALIKTVYCVDEEQTWNLMDLDDQVAVALGVSTFIGGLIISTTLLLGTLLPLGYLYSGKNKNPTLPCLILGLSLSGVCMALGWFPVWLYAITILLIAVMYGAKFAGLIGGEKS